MYEIFKKFKQRKKQKEPKSSFTITKSESISINCGVCSFGLSLIGAIRANVMAGNVIRLSQQLETINKDVKKKKKKRVYDSSALSFMSEIL